MYYGYAPHVPSPEDRTVVACRCGWFSPEMVKKEMSVPWYCNACGKQVTRFATFAPHERPEAYQFLITHLKDESSDELNRRLALLLTERGVILRKKRSA